jgi:hypothetical protein
MGLGASRFAISLNVRSKASGDQCSLTADFTRAFLTDTISRQIAGKQAAK